MTNEEALGRTFRLACLTDMWIRMVNEHALADQRVLERRIALDVLALCGAQEAHAQAMKARRTHASRNY